MLQSRLQAAEAHQEDLSFMGQEATRPLLRQIESLQAQYSSSQKDWETLEKNMLGRVREAESSRALLQERERELLEDASLLV